MPKKSINSFNAGELSPYLYARSDLEKYQSGCLTMENFAPLPYGGAARRPALKYDGDSKQDDKIRLIPFMASVADSYVLELGDGYMRFWQDGALIDDGSDPIEIGTPWAEADLFDIKFAQSVDVMWLVHPDYPAQKLSRIASDEWTIEDESFDYPPLLEENDTDIVITPDALTGDVTLTASRDFFDAGHVGGYFRFDAIRCLDGQNLNDTFENVSGISEEIYVGGSDWEITTTGTWGGKLTIQRSDDGGSSWEDYVNLIDTRFTTQNTDFRNVSFSSDEPEPFGRRLRLSFIVNSTVLSNCTYDLNVKSITWPTLVKITGYTSATEVVGEIIGEFQDLTSDYTAWAASTSYSVGDKVSIDAGINHVSGGDVTLTAIDANLDEVVGCDFGGDQFWMVTEGISNQKIYKLDSGLTTVDASHDISSEFTEVKDIAYYASNVYVSGIASGLSVVKKFTTAGSFVSTEYTVTAADKLEGLGYHNGFFYIGLDRGLLSSVRKFTTSWTFTGTLNYTQTEGEQDDVTGVNDRIYAVNDDDESIDIYNESLDSLGSVSISSETSSPSGVAWDGTNLWVTELNSGGTAKIYKYEVIEKDLYYECVNDHTSSSTFGTDYALGYWSERSPEMTTWTEGAFSDYRGHATAIALFESRLVYAGAGAEPDTVWMSRIDNFSNFQIGEIDDDGIKLILGGGQLNEIQWLVPQERLVIGTSGSEWTLGASDERKAITPTGFDLKRKTSYGSKNIQGLLVNSAVLFLMRQSRKVREWTPNYNMQDYVAPDLSILAEHITEGGITQWDYQQQPDNILWGIRSDGTLLGFTYERDQNVTGWHRHNNDEFEFESVAIIPRSDMEDEIWLSVKIVVDGNTKRYIGRLNDREWGSDYLTEWQGLDLYTVYSSPASATLTGLDYLEGETVGVVADGVIKDNEVVSSGQITIDSDAYTTVTVGLPFTSKLAPVYLTLENQYGTSKGGKTGASKARLHFKDTYSAKVGQTESDVESARFSADDSALYSDYAEVYMDNANEYLQTCYVVQDEPMPCTVLAMIPEVEV